MQYNCSRPVRGTVTPPQKYIRNQQTRRGAEKLHTGWEIQTQQKEEVVLGSYISLEEGL